MNGTVLHSSTHSYRNFKSSPTWADFNINGPAVSQSFRVVVYVIGLDSQGGGAKIGYDVGLSSSYSDIVMGKRVVTDWKDLPFNQRTLSNRPHLNWMIRVCSTPGAEALIVTTSQATTTSQSSTPFLGSFDISRLQQIGGLAATGGTAVLGYFFKTRKRRLISGYLNKIESTTKDSSTSPEERKKRLDKIREEVLDLMKKGKIEESQFSMLDTQLREHVKEIT